MGFSSRSLYLSRWFCLFLFQLFATVVRSVLCSVQGHYKLHSTHKPIIHQLLIYRELDLWEIYDIRLKGGNHYYSNFR